MLTFVFYFPLPFFFSSFEKYFEDIVSFLSQISSDLSILTPWQSVCDSSSLSYLSCHRSDSIRVNSRRINYIFYIFKRMVSLSVHDDNTTLVMTDLFKHMVHNTEKRKLIDGKFTFCFVVRASNSSGLNVVDGYPESLSPPS